MINIGSLAISWEEVLEALSTMRQAARTSPQLLRGEEFGLENRGARIIREAQHIKDAKLRRVQLGIERLVSGFRHTQTTDPRDRSFAFLSLVNGSANSPFQPNYTVSFENIFLELACHSFGASPHYDVFSINNVDFSKRELKLSWPPQWDRPINDDLLAPGIFRPTQTCLFSAGLGENMPPPKATDGTILTTGVYLGEVQSGSPISEQYFPTTRRSQSPLLRTIVEDREKSNEPGTFRRIDWSSLEHSAELPRETSPPGHEQSEANDGSWKYSPEYFTSRASHLHLSHY